MEVTVRENIRTHLKEAMFYLLIFLYYLRPRSFLSQMREEEETVTHLCNDHHVSFVAHVLCG